MMIPVKKKIMTFGYKKNEILKNQSKKFVKSRIRKQF